MSPQKQVKSANWRTKSALPWKGSHSFSTKYHDNSIHLLSSLQVFFRLLLSAHHIYLIIFSRHLNLGSNMVVGYKLQQIHTIQCKQLKNTQLGFPAASRWKLAKYLKIKWNAALIFGLWNSTGCSFFEFWTGCPLNSKRYSSTIILKINVFN